MTVHIDYQEEHDLLRDAARRWLAENSAITEVRKLAADEHGDTSNMWAGLAEMGWLGMLMPEEFEGSELGATHLAVLMEESGRRLLPAPLLPTMLASLLIAQAGTDVQRKQWLPGIASGQYQASIAHVGEDGRWQFGQTQTMLENGALNGSMHQVWGAATANLLIVPFLNGGQTQLALIPTNTTGINIEAEIGLDPSRRQGRVSLTNVELAGEMIMTESAAHAFKKLLPWACLTLSAEMAGGIDALLTMTAEYATTREQFDKQIGSFQAIKHPLVNVLIELEKTRSLVYAAAAALDSGHEDAEKLARMAKAQASDTYPFAASRAIQFHGGFGFTEECDAHLYMRRAQCTRPAFGDATHHRTWLGENLRG
ncbi:MAG: acyl-CoA dehydrogenase [Pseudomonadota bacterium]